ncbi:NAD-aldehyde dehydrogenase [Amylostereum chailletii]|nr:NAD-aldehyde dehydrogenase [Amylostereum chailletii]
MFLARSGRVYLGRARPLSRALSTRASTILSALDIPTTPTEINGVYDGEWKGSGEPFESVCPTTGEVLARVKSASPQELQGALDRSRDAYKILRNMPAPRRGEIIRQIREALSAKREELGALVSLEMGKIKTEGVGEVQEFVDMVPSVPTPPPHYDILVPNPLGVVAVLSAFNFPVAVYGWNLSLSLAAGNATLWKPSPTTPLCSIAVTKIVAGVLEKNGLPGAIAGLVTGGKDVGEAVVESKSVDMVSFTGSEEVGRKVGKVVQSRFGKVLLELGGNNASIIMPDADMSLAVPAVFFGAVGTAGQRCTSTRRLYLHRDIAPQFLERLQVLYKSVRPGDPLDTSTLLGPLHNSAALNIYHNTISSLKNANAEILAGGSRFDETPLDKGFFTVDPSHEMWSTERFAPILNTAVFDELEQAIEWNNAVPQGLSSSLWTRDLRNVGKWIGPAGSDAGIVNVNVGTSGAEIGAAFGGNKSTGWGRESGGDAWKQYVRWSACTINFSDAAPLAQGVNFST